MSNGIRSLPRYQERGPVDQDLEAKRLRLLRLIEEHRARQAADYRRKAEVKAAEKFEEWAGPAIDDSTLRSMQPLLDSLQHMTGPVPEGDGYTGYSESGDIPFSVRPEEPKIASGEAHGLYFHPSQQDQENIVIDTGPEALRHDPRFIAMHEIGHAVNFRDPKGERGWLSPELREAISGREAPFDTEGQYYWDPEGDTSHERVADYIGEAIDFLQTSKNSAIDPEYTRQYLSERPHLQKMTEELLQLPIYQEHPLLTGSLGEAYEPEPSPIRPENAFASSMRDARETFERSGMTLPEGLKDLGIRNADSEPDFTPAQVARIDELARRIDMGLGRGPQEGDTDAIWDAVAERLNAMKQREPDERYRSRFLPAS